MATRQTEALKLEAAAWFARLQNSGAPAEDEQAFEAWIDADPARAVAYARVEATWERAERLTALETAPMRAPPPESPIWMSRRAAAAALVTLGLVGAGSAAGLLGSAHARTYVSALGQRRTVVLEDGSRLTLNTDTQVRVAYGRHSRGLRLDRGEALFEVAKDAARPFVVTAGDARVRAVGTEFNIRLKDKVAEVTVTEGVVAVGDGKATRGALASPTAPHFKAGSAAVIAPGTVARVDLDAEALRTRLAWRQGMIELRGETLEQAVAEFNRYSARKLVIGDPRIASIRVGGEFGTMESDKFVEALKSGFNVRPAPSQNGDIYLLSAS